MAYRQDTICVQGGYRPKSGESRIPPITQSTTYLYESTQAMADLFDLKTDGYFYSRLANPTVAAFEGKVAALEGGVAAVAVAAESGVFPFARACNLRFRLVAVDKRAPDSSPFGFLLFHIHLAEIVCPRRRYLFRRAAKTGRGEGYALFPTMPTSASRASA